MYAAFTKNCTLRDLAARNVLLADNLLAKVSDFGRAVCLHLEQAEIVDTDLHDAPIRWLAPESLHSCAYSTNSDVWYVRLGVKPIVHPVTCT